MQFPPFLSSLRWLVGSHELGNFWASCLEILILFEVWAGHRLSPEKTVPADKRLGRVLKLPTSCISEGVQIRQGCQFIGGFFGCLDKLEEGAWQVSALPTWGPFF